MSRRVILTNAFARSRAHQMIDRAPPGYVVTVAEQKRSN